MSDKDNNKYIDKHKDTDKSNRQAQIKPQHKINAKKKLLTECVQLAFDLDFARACALFEKMCVCCVQ